MSINRSALGSGSRTARSTFEFGRTYVVRPKGRHQATIVWLHGLGDKGSRHLLWDRRSIKIAPCVSGELTFKRKGARDRKGYKPGEDKGPPVHCLGCPQNYSIGTELNWSQLLETLSLPNIKWICPTAPTRPVALFGGFPCTAWCDVGEISEDAPDDLEGLDAAAAHVANLLSTEPADIKLGVGGFSMGAATALYSATCRVLGQYGNGNPYLVNLSAIVGLSGWLPCSRTLRNRMEGSQEAMMRAASLHILLCHGLDDDVVAYKHGEKSAQTLSSAGFRDIMFRTYNGLGHYTIPEETNDVCNWLAQRLALEG